MTDAPRPSRARRQGPAGGGADPQGGPAGRPRPVELRHRRRPAADADPAVRLRPVAGRQERADRRGAGGSVVPGQRDRRQLPALALFRDPRDPIDGRGPGADAVGQGRRHRAGAGRLRPPAAQGDASVQVLVNGIDGNTARIIEAYAEAAVAQSGARLAAEGQDNSSAGGQAVVESQLWFNSANDSRYFLVPGLIVLIITLIGAFMTSMVVAREWERGTFEALFVTPVRTDEILLGKIVPYFLLGMVGLLLCMGAARFLFDVPIRGSVADPAGRLDALSAGLGRDGPVDLLEPEEPVPGQPGHAGGHLHAGADAVGLHLRPAQRAAGDPADQLPGAGALFRQPAADPVPGRRRVERDPAQRRHPGGGAPSSCWR